MSSKNNKTILIPILEYGEFTELFRIACKLAKQHDVIFYFLKKSYRNLHEDSDIVCQNQMCWLDHNGAMHLTAAAKKQTNINNKTTEEARKKHPAWKQLLIDLHCFSHEYLTIRRDYKKQRRCLQKHQPDVILIGQDYIGSPISLVLHAASELNIPSKLIPFAMVNDSEHSAVFYKHPDYQTHTRPLNRLVARYFPKWQRVHNDIALCRLPGYKALALELLGLSNDNPWTPCKGKASQIAVDSIRSKAHFNSMQLDNVTITGNLYQDTLFAHQQQANNHIETILLCWPANLFWAHKTYPEFDNYYDLCEQLAAIVKEACEQFDIDIIIKPHPKTLPEEKEIISKHGLTYNEDDTATLLPISNLLVTIPSSITAWAISLGIPVIEYDMYELDYDDFAEEEAVVCCNTLGNFKKAMFELLENPEKYQQLQNIQQQRKEYWGEPDGKAEKRLREFILAQSS